MLGQGQPTVLQAMMVLDLFIGKLKLELVVSKHM